MKEFVFRYRKAIIIITILITLMVLSKILYSRNLITADASKFISLLFYFSIFIISIIVHANNQSNNILGRFKNISINYSNGKYIYILSTYFANTTKEKSYRDKELTKEFGKANIKFYRNNISLFKKEKQGLVWASNRLSQVLKSRGKVHVLDFIISIATRDKFLSTKELKLLRKMCKAMRVHYNTLDAILAMYNYQSEEELNQQAEQEKLKKYEPNALARYYKILELPLNASVNEIKESYRRLVKLYHPDKKKGLKMQFLLVQEAYEVIKENKNFK